MFPNKSLLLIVVLLSTSLFPHALARLDAAPKGPRSVDIQGTEFYLMKFEQRVKKADGKPFKLGSQEQRALKEIKELCIKWPDNLKVKELFKRAKAALKGSKGQNKVITPEMLAYREKGKTLSNEVSARAKKKWQEYVKSIKTRDNFLEKTFPVPGPTKVPADSMKGKTIVLEGFEYPRNEFTDDGVSFVSIGSKTKGMYYIDVSARSFIGPYEAIKRYKRQVSSVIPDKWTIVGTIGDPSLKIPEAGEKKTIGTQWGWEVEPVALYVPGRVFAIFDENNELGAHYVGEKDVDDIIAKGFSITAIPDDVKPGRLMEILLTAIKEKNFNLFLDCIAPEKKKGPLAIQRLRYLWDNQQELFSDYYAHAEVSKVGEVSIVQGGVTQTAVEDFFMDEETKTELAKHAEPLLEEVKVTVKVYNALGRIVARPSASTLTRRERKRWYIWYGYYF